MINVVVFNNVIYKDFWVVCYYLLVFNELLNMILVFFFEF